MFARSVSNLEPQAERNLKHRRGKQRAYMLIFLSTQEECSTNIYELAFISVLKLNPGGAFPSQEKVLIFAGQIIQPVLNINLITSTGASIQPKSMPNFVKYTVVWLYCKGMCKESTVKRTGKNEERKHTQC